MKLPKFWIHLFSLSLLLLLVVLGGCKAKSSAPSTANPTTPPIATGTAVTLSGSLSYDLVPTANGKLNYAGTLQKPMRKVYLELLNASTGATLASANCNESGQYTLAATTGIALKLRVYAEIKSPPIIIQDNTNSSAQYALVTSNFTLSGDTTRDVRAVSGWSGTNNAGSYAGTRVAAPFAMLDSLYTISKKITTARPAIALPLLRLNWSINNISVDGVKSSGQIGTSHYSSYDKQLYILGQADVDSDEYDKHIIVHEWGHFFEDNLSRSDSWGGSHSGGDAKDMSLAFGEGWGNALSAMAFDPDVYYTDTYGSRQQSGFQINMESGADTNSGWFSEASVHQILFDIYDSSNEAGDNLSLGIGPIIDVLTTYQKTTPASTSIFSFITGLKINTPSSSGALDTLVATKNISAINNAYGSTEVNDGGWDKNLPIYNLLSVGGASVPVFLYGAYVDNDFYGLFNSIFNNKYLKFTAASSKTRLTVTSTDSFQLDVYNKGSYIYTSSMNQRASGGAFGPFVYDVTTVAGQEYRVNIFTDRSVIFNKAALVNLAVGAAAL